MMNLSARILTDWSVGTLASIVQNVRILEEEGAVGFQLQPLASHGATTQMVNLSETLSLTCMTPFFPFQSIIQA